MKPANKADKAFEVINPATNSSVLDIYPTGTLAVGDGTADLDTKIYMGNTSNYLQTDFGNKKLVLQNSQAGGDAPQALDINVVVLAGTSGYRQGAINVSVARAAGQEFAATWDGNADEGVKITSRNSANNLDGATLIGGARALNAQARNSGTNLAWVKAIEFNGRNDSSSITDDLSVLHLRAENYGTVNTSIVGIDLEMSSENDTSSPTKDAILVRNTDASGMTAVRSVLRVTHTSTNGFTHLLSVVDTDGSDTVTIGSIPNSNPENDSEAGYISILVNATTYAIPIYDIV